MAKRLILICAIWVLLGSCARPPYQELAEARAELARAYASGAARLAPDDYRVAADALRDGEALIAAGDYQNARHLLPFVVGYARRAQFMSREAANRKELAEGPRPPAPDRSARAELRNRPTRPTGEKTAGHQAQTMPLSAQPLAATHTVRDGETLWTIAGEPGIYGDPLLWPLIYQANRDQIKDPGQVFSGQVLTIPREASAVEVHEAREKAKASRLFLDAPPPGSPLSPSR